MERSAKLEFKMAAVICFLLPTLKTTAMAGVVCAGVSCDSGQCVSKSAFCNGNCDCGDCSDEMKQNCPFHDSPADAGYSANLGSGAIVGIVVAAICILLLLIAILIVFLICRIRKEALKNRRTRSRSDDPSLMVPGCAIPVDIPIEALAREPPPQYTPRDECTAGTSVPASTSLPSNQFNISVLPPPYYAPGASSRMELSYSCDAPPKYQSQTDLSGLTPKMDASKETPEARRNSIDSFVGVPSMTNILLTSSRSSVLGTRSFQGSGGSGSRHDLGPSQKDSACGESLDSRTHGSIATSPHSSTMNADSRSRSLSNILSETVEIPQFGLQRHVQGSRGLHQKSDLPYRSVPVLTTGNEELTGRDRTSEQTRNPPRNTARKQKQGRYRKREDAESKGEEGLSTIQRPAEYGLGGRLMSNKRHVSQSLPQLTTLNEEMRWEEVGSCDV